MSAVGTGVDVGSRTAVALQGRVKGNTFAVSDFAAVRHAGDVAEAWEALGPTVQRARCRVGISGRDVNVRYTRVPRVPDWQLRKLMRFEVAEIGPSGATGASDVASDFNVLPEIPEIEGEDVVLLALARESVLEEHLEGLAAAGARLDAFTPNAIALYNAWLRYGVVMEDTALVANVGRDNVDVVLARGTDLLFARNLSGGSGLFDRALAQAFGIGVERAERLKVERGTLAAGGDATSERVARALMAPAGQLLSLLQSTVAFCKSQVKLSGLELDRVMLCGGGSALPGLERYLSDGLRVPVERFDPFAVVDVSGLSPEKARELEAHGREAVCALGLATAAADAEAYAIEIVPQRVARRRELWGAKAFLVAAGVLAVGYVGYDAWRTQGELTEAQARVRQLESQLDRARRAHNATEETLERNADLAGLTHELYALAGSGEQAARVLAALHDALPQAFWITHFSSEWRVSEELGVEREQPVLHVEGRAREGTESVSRLFDDFVRSVAEALPEARIVHSLTPTQTGFALDLTLLSVPEVVASAEGGAGEDDDGDGTEPGGRS